MLDESEAKTERAPGKVITKLTSQKQTLAMARFFDQREISRRETTRAETVLGIFSAVIIYGVGAGFLVYLLFLATSG
jgi:hypothetical protein